MDQHLQQLKSDMEKATSVISNRSMTSDVLVNSDIKLDIGSKFSTPVDKDALSILNEIEGILENEAKASFRKCHQRFRNRTCISKSRRKKYRTKFK